MKKIIDKHKYFWKQKSQSINLMFSMLMIFASLIANYFANIYVTNHAGNYVSDIILDNLPVVNIDLIFVEGALAAILFSIFLIVKYPEKSLFVLKSGAIFILIRSFFIILTHTGLPPDHSYLDPSSTFRYITAGNDMFFSSHTGMPFLMALNFWNNKKIRLIFIAISVIFAISVLLGHLHYSIDVFAAFFITYSIFHICQRLFPKDYQLLNERTDYGE
jgi:hypothetical protein